jgi:hypothetical protein
MGTRATVATDGARVMVWMGEDEREIMVEGEGGMEEGVSCATGMISATEMKNTQVKLRAQCVVLYISGQSAKFLLREPYDRIRPFSPVFVQPITATARTNPCFGSLVRYGTRDRKYGTAPVTVNTGRTPVGPATARSPTPAFELLSPVEVERAEEELPEKRGN